MFRQFKEKNKISDVFFVISDKNNERPDWMIVLKPH
jgi:hypothetical protein